MKRVFIFICFVLSLCLSLSAQEKITNLHISGYKVVIIPSKTFSMDIKHPQLSKKEIKGNSLRLDLIDKTGKMPKDTVIIHTDKIKTLYLHNCELEVNECFVTDSLELKCLSSVGSLNIKSDYLKINLAAGCRFQARGATKYFVANIRAASQLDAKSLLSDVAEIEATAHSILSVNAKEVIRWDNTNASITNIGEKQ